MADQTQLLELKRWIEANPDDPRVPEATAMFKKNYSRYKAQAPQDNYQEPTLAGYDVPGGETAGNISSGLSEGAAGLPGDLMDMVNKGVDSLIRIPQRLVTGEDPGPTVFGRSNFGGETRGALRDVGVTAAPRDPNSTVRRISDMAGGGIASLGAAPALARQTGAALSRPSVEVAKETAAAPLAAGGEEALGALGQIVGGETGEAIGRTAGALAGGIAPEVPGGAAQLPAKGFRREDGHRAQEIQSALDRQGVRSSFGLTGNEHASAVENTMGAIPFVGRPASRIQEEQVTELQGAVRRLASEIRGRPSDGPVDPSEIGGHLSRNLEATTESAKNKVKDPQRAFEEEIGARTPIDPEPTISRAEKMLGTEDPLHRPALEEQIGRFREGATEPLVPALHDRLIQRRADNVTRGHELRRRERTANDPQEVDKARAQRKVLAKELEDIERDIADNMGVPYEVARKMRNTIGKRGNKTEQGIAEGAQKQLYGALTGSIDDAAERVGGPELAEKWRVMNQEAAPLMDKQADKMVGGDIPYLRSLASRREYRQLFNQAIVGGLQEPGRLRILRDNMEPEAYQDMIGDTIEWLGQAKPGMATDEGAFSSDTFLTNWNKMAPQAKAMVLDNPQLVSDMDDIATIAQAMRGRNSAGNSSRSAYTGVIAHGLFAGASLGLLPGALLTATNAHLITRAAMRETFARSLVGQSPKFREKVLSRLGGTVAREGEGRENIPEEIN